MFFIVKYTHSNFHISPIYKAKNEKYLCCDLFQYTIEPPALSFTAGQYYGFMWHIGGVVAFNEDGSINYCYSSVDSVQGDVRYYGTLSGNRAYSVRVVLEF